jgi:hypothetical protein
MPRASKQAPKVDRDAAYRAWTSFSADRPIKNLVVTRGMTLKGNHPIVRAFPHHFVRADETTDADLVQMEAESIATARMEVGGDDATVRTPGKSNLWAQRRLVMVEESGGVRDLKILAGEGMLTPVRPIISRDGKQRYFPKRHRFSVDAELVRERPELFQLCMPKRDRTTARAEFRATLEAAERAVARDLATARGGGAYAPHVADSRRGREPWRLDREPAWRL